MREFLTGVQGGFVFGISLGSLRLNVPGSRHWNDEQKVLAVCGGFIGVVAGFFALSTAILTPIVWLVS